MKRQTRLSQTQEHQTEAVHQQTSEQGTHEFATAEEMLQYDAAQTEVPDVVTKRLQKTLGPAKASWWKTLFGG